MMIPLYIFFKLINKYHTYSRILFSFLRMGLGTSCFPKYSGETSETGSAKYDWQAERAASDKEWDAYMKKHKRIKNTLRDTINISQTIEMQAYTMTDDVGKLVHQLTSLVALEMVHKSEERGEYIPSMNELQRRLNNLRK
jgi:hypothetical protein